MFNLFRYIKAMFALAITPTLAEEPARILGTTSNVSTVNLDEQSLNIYIRGNMHRLEYLAKQHHASYLAQWEAYIADINAPSGDGVFIKLEARKKLLLANYEPVRCSIVKEMRRYDNYCADRKMAYSDAWNRLLKDLQPYLSGITTLGSVIPS